MLFLALLLACPAPVPASDDVPPPVVEARELVPVFPEGTDPGDPSPATISAAPVEDDAPLPSAVPGPIVPEAAPQPVPVGPQP